MEGESNILDAIFEDDNFDNGEEVNFDNGEDINFDNGEDIEMLDVEEGELVEFNWQNGSGQSSGGHASVSNQERTGKNQNKKRKAKNRKNKRKKGDGRSLGPNVTDIDRFVIEACRRLKEKKSYLVYTAVGCLGIAAMSDLIKEVDAIQACGGQMTQDGRRFRSGGGVLWSIIKAREPKAYKEIMKKARDFEKQFKRPSIQAIGQRKEGSSHVIANSSKDDATPANASDGLPVICQIQTERDHSNPEGKHISVQDRLRRPVSYDDDLLGGAPADDSLDC